MDKQTLLAVLQVLKKYNLKDTELLLKKEAHVTEDEVKAEPSASGVTDVLAAYKSEGDPRRYESFYSSLKNFIEKSLDIHKCELSMVLYPVFVHMYLELVYNHHEQQAIQFFYKFSADQEWYYQEDLVQLATVTKAEHMAGNQLLDNFKGSKFTIRMSRDSYNHLKRHLLEQKLNILLTIIQDHLFIDVFDGVPRTKQQIDATAGGMCGEARREANKTKVLYGLLKEPEINITVEDEDEGQETDDKPKKKKAKKDSQLNKKQKHDPNAPQLTRIPLPEMTDQMKLEKARAFKEGLRRINLSAETLPSICFYTLLNSYHGVTSVDFCEDSSLMAAGFADSQIRVWTMTPNKLRAIKTSDDLNIIDKEADDVYERLMDDRTSVDCRLLCGHSGAVYATSFTPDRTQMVSCSEDGTIRLWSLLTWSNLVCYKGHNFPVWDVHFSPLGHYFVSCGHDRTARVWSTDHFQPLRIFSGHVADVDTVQFHPNCNYIATGSSDRTVCLWDLLNGNCVRVMTGHKAPIYSLIFSPCGRYLASAGADKNVLIWDLANGDLISQLKGHKDTIFSLCFSRGGALLASGGLDNIVRLWNFSKLLEDHENESTVFVFFFYRNESSAYEIMSYPTKSTPILSLHFTRRNLLLATGPFKGNS
ncbi:hypothetical protein CAPTEDRAFT_225253 [Capitella teleta]|uniref:Transcription initiation factor TFIID subunit 5 n=1 Tax=Capitella teleta TaxID=283909 RepID=R7T522_CAPTE|nr:hypothetical protein CAPTEDRAFT_225253 [Capitella teleta]|eukprot:ELT88262.1 hypothetical protein CAPTEDRAFT_225253 [Capitella teleta]